jgi:hypothetical protein
VGVRVSAIVADVLEPVPWLHAGVDVVGIDMSHSV